MADGNLAAFRIVRQSAVGVTPANPAFQELLYTSASLTPSVSTETDDSVSVDRQVTDLNVTGYDSEGDLTVRARFGAHDDLIEAALGGTWTNRPNNTFTAVATGTTLTVAAGGTAFVAGMVIRMTGTAGNAGAVRRVASSTATTIVTSGAALNNETSVVGSVRVVGFEGVSGDIVAAVGPNRLTSTTLNFTTLGIQAGDWLKIAAGANGFATASNNGFVRVASVTANAIVLDSVPTGWAADAGTGRTVRVLYGDRVTNGLTRRRHTVEKSFIRASDSTAMFRYFRDIELDMSMSISARSLIEMTFPMMGAEVTTYSTSRFSGATTLPAIAGPVYDASSNVGTIRVGNQDFTTAIPELSFELTNNMRGRESVGKAWVDSLGQGRFELSGSLTAYMGDATLVNAVQTNSEFSLSIPLLALDRATGYMVDIPRFKFSDGGDEFEGIDTDIIPALDFQGLRSPTLGYTVSISRFAYLE